MSKTPSHAEFPGPIASDYDGPSLLHVKSLVEQQLELALEIAHRAARSPVQSKPDKTENAVTLEQMHKNHRQIIRILDTVTGSIARENKAVGRG